MRNMARKKRTKKEPAAKQNWFVQHLPKLLAGLLATGAVGGTAMGNNANERVAVVETKVQRSEVDIQKMDAKIDVIDSRTDKMAEHLHSIMDSLKVDRDDK